MKIQKEDPVDGEIDIRLNSVFPGNAKNSIFLHAVTMAETFFRYINEQHPLESRPLIINYAMLQHACLMDLIARTINMPLENLKPMEIAGFVPIDGDMMADGEEKLVTLVKHIYEHLKKENKI